VIELQDNLEQPIVSMESLDREEWVQCCGRPWDRQFGERVPAEFQQVSREARDIYMDKEKLVEEGLVLKTSVDETATRVSDQADDRPVLDSRYEVHECLGQGGMGTVYKVYDTELKSFLAAKFIRKELAEDKQAVKRFEQEIKAASELNHENLVSVYGSGRTRDNVPYLLMDYVEGKSLADELKQNGPLSFERALKIFSQVCIALEYAHGLNVIHRDLKPSNIMLRASESGADDVRILDFGIAKVLPSEGSDFNRTNLTQTGDIFGSPLYMSPEQCQNNPQDARSDIYALGCVLYESLSGVQPFLDKNPVKIILKHMNYEAPLVSTKASTDERIQAFDGIVQKCLEKSPDDRYQNIRELFEDLQTVERGKVLAPKKAKKTEKNKSVSRGRKYALATGIALIVGVSLAIASEGVKLYNIFYGSSDSFSDATSLDAKSYAYFLRGQYEKAAPLLEFGIATYREKVEQDRKNNNNDQALKDETLLTENIQHVGKCYLEIAKRAKTEGDVNKAKLYFTKALERYREAMKFWMRYNHSAILATMAPEAIAEYEIVLKELGLNDELKNLNDWKSR
jgi:serine/threonine protein kinase